MLSTSGYCLELQKVENGLKFNLNGFCFLYSMVNGSFSFSKDSIMVNKVKKVKMVTKIVWIASENPM